MLFWEIKHWKKQAKKSLKVDLMTMSLFTLLTTEPLVSINNNFLFHKIKLI